MHGSLLQIKNITREIKSFFCVLTSLSVCLSVPSGLNGGGGSCIYCIERRALPRRSHYKMHITSPLAGKSFAKSREILAPVCQVTKSSIHDTTYILHTEKI